MIQEDIALENQAVRSEVEETLRALPCNCIHYIETSSKGWPSSIRVELPHGVFFAATGSRYFMQYSAGYTARTRLREVVQAGIMQ